MPAPRFFNIYETEGDPAPRSSRASEHPVPATSGPVLTDYPQHQRRFTRGEFREGQRGMRRHKSELGEKQKV